MSPLENKYTIWYYSIIEAAKLSKFECYTEYHHIVPRSLGGTDKDSNLVKLTAKQHFICHLLLTKMFEPKTYEYYKMIHAFCMMDWCASNSKMLRYTSKVYEKQRKEFSVYMSKKQSGEGNNQYGTKWAYNEELKESRKFPKGSDIPEGWVWGRVLNWDEYILQKERRNLLSLQHTYISLKTLEASNQPIEYTHKCSVCCNLYVSLKPKSTYCSSKCSNYYRYKNPRLVMLRRDDQYKEVKAQNVPAYKKIGWVSVN